MHTQTDRSCWGVAGLTVASFLLITMVAYLVGGLDPVVIAAR